MPSSSRSRLHLCQAFAWLHQNHASLTTTSYLGVHYSGMATEQRTCRKDSSLVSARASRVALTSERKQPKPKESSGRNNYTISGHRDSKLLKSRSSVLVLFAISYQIFLVRFHWKLLNEVGDCQCQLVSIDCLNVIRYFYTHGLLLNQIYATVSLLDLSPSN